MLNFIRVVFCPVVGLVVVVSVCSISGRSVLRCLTIDFLFVMITPPIAWVLLTNAVRSCFAGFASCEMLVRVLVSPSMSLIG